MDLNALQQYMDFADKNGLFNQYKNIGNGSGFQPTQFNVPMMEANWARGMGGPSLPQGAIPGGTNFFAGFAQNPPPGVQNGVNPYSAQAQTLQSQPFTNQPERPQVMNYLSRLLK